MEVEIDGIKYRLKDQQKAPVKNPSKIMTMLSIISGGLDLYNSSKKTKEHPRVDLLKEFGLIQQKKSKLSKSQRDWVEYQFNKNFKLCL